ncbi:hypothetical protein MYMA111404_03405 [Mycoplasma marinum]
MNKIETLNGEITLSKMNNNWFKLISLEEYEEKANKDIPYGKASKVWKDVFKRFF